MSPSTDEVDSVRPVSVFDVHLDNFEGPFDLLLQLISKHQLDITEVSLSRVTDDFIAHVKALGAEWELEQTTQFLVVAATLLDLKIVRLLPSADLEDPEDLALLEARDLLFARLMQYRAFKHVAALFEKRMSEEARHVPRSVGLDERFANVLPDVLITLGVDEFAALAAAALEPRPEQSLGLAHMHAPQVSVREQAATIVARLRRTQSTTFRALVADSPDTLTTVARFLALLELFREGAVAFDQLTPLGELSIRWTGPDDSNFEVGDEYDDKAPVDEPAAESVTSDEVRRLGGGPGNSAGVQPPSQPMSQPVAESVADAEVGGLGGVPVESVDVPPVTEPLSGPVAEPVTDDEVRRIEGQPADSADVQPPSQPMSQPQTKAGTDDEPYPAGGRRGPDAAPDEAGRA